MDGGRALHSRGQRQNFFGHFGQSGAALCIGVMLLVSAVRHLSNPYYFLGSIYAYHVVGPNTGKFIAMTLPMLQLVLVTPFPKPDPGNMGESIRPIVPERIHHEEASRCRTDRRQAA